MVLIAVAESLGVKFRREAGPAGAPPQALEMADPEALAAYLGQPEMHAYQAPRRGLLIDPPAPA